MTKILTASITPTLASSLLTLAAEAFRRVLAALNSKSDVWSRRLSPRLRYDLGELDINPDKVRSSFSASDLGAGREMLCRAY